MGRLRTIRASRDAGVATSEYAVTAVAACGFGGILVKLLTSGPIVNLLARTIEKALNFAF